MGLEAMFLVRLNAATFLSSLRQGKVYETNYPTVAMQLSFPMAAELARRFKLMGFEAAAVTDLYGSLPSSEDLARARGTTESVVVLTDRRLYFAGMEGSSQRLTKDIKDAVRMSRESARIIMLKLREAGHKDAAIEDAIVSFAVEAEVERIWAA